MARENVRMMRMAKEEKYCSAAIVLQKFFRMWKAQANLINMQLQMVGSDTSQRLPVADVLDDEASDTQSEASELTSDPHLAQLSAERKEKIARMFGKKTLWSEKESSYYDAVSLADSFLCLFVHVS